MALQFFQFCLRSRVIIIKKKNNNNKTKRQTTDKKNKLFDRIIRRTKIIINKTVGLNVEIYRSVLETIIFARHGEIIHCITHVIISYPYCAVEADIIITYRSPPPDIDPRAR